MRIYGDVAIRHVQVQCAKGTTVRRRKPALDLGLLGPGVLTVGLDLATGSFGRTGLLEIMMDFGLAMLLALRNKQTMFT